MDKTAATHEVAPTSVKVQDILDAARKTVECLENLPPELEVKDGMGWLASVVPVLVLERR